MKAVMIQAGGHYFLCQVPDDFDQTQYRQVLDLKLKLTHVIGHHHTQSSIAAVYEGDFDIINSQAKVDYPQFHRVSLKPKGT